MSETELRPCPFCGKTPAYAKVIFGMEKEIRVAVHCANCSFNLGFFDGKEEALKKWNTRAEDERRESD